MVDLGHDLSRCEIHDSWVGLLKRYVNGQITSRRYVEDTLVLLKDNKTRLRMAGYGRRNANPNE